MIQPKVIGIGLSALDIVQKLEHLPTWDIPGRVDEILFDGGGPTGTGMVTLAKLGVNVGFVGTAGNDWVGEIKIRTLSDNNVDVSRVVWRDHPETQIIFCYVDAISGERIFTGLKNINPTPLQPVELDRDYIIEADYLHMEGFHHEASIQAAHWMHAAGKKVVLDGAAVSTGTLEPRHKELTEVTDILICGDGFVQALTGIQDDISAAKAALECGPEIVVVTKGDQGNHLVTATEQFHTPAFKVDVVDTTGAGDVFHGAFIYGLLESWDLRKIAKFASAASAIECTKLGGRAGIPKLNEVQAFLERYDQ